MENGDRLARCLERRFAPAIHVGRDPTGTYDFQAGREPAGFSGDREKKLDPRSE
jgi:hypothetical protein